MFQSNLAGCIKTGDLTTFSALLAEVAPLDDQEQLSLPDDEKQVSAELSLRLHTRYQHELTDI